MAYTAPTAASFKVRFPAFAAVADAAVTAALAEAARQVDNTWLEGDRANAEMFYAAHILTLDGLGTSSEAQLAGFKRLKVGPLELERAEVKGQTFGALGSTSYGQRFMLLRKQNHPAVLVV